MKFNFNMYRKKCTQFGHTVKNMTICKEYDARNIIWQTKKGGLNCDTMSCQHNGLNWSKTEQAVMDTIREMEAAGERDGP